MKWRHNVNHIIIACKNFFYEIHDNLFVANIFRRDLVFAVRVLYQSGCYIKVAKIVIANKFISGKWQNKMVAKILGLQYIIELFT